MQIFLSAFNWPCCLAWRKINKTQINIKKHLEGRKTQDLTTIRPQRTQHTLKPVNFLPWPLCAESTKSLRIFAIKPRLKNYFLIILFYFFLRKKANREENKHAWLKNKNSFKRRWNIKRLYWSTQHEREKWKQETSSRHFLLFLFNDFSVLRTAVGISRLEFLELKCFSAGMFFSFFLVAVFVGFFRCTVSIDEKSIRVERGRSFGGNILIFDKQIVLSRLIIFAQTSCD